jgi:hypothetical protein
VTRNAAPGRTRRGVADIGRRNGARWSDHRCEPVGSRAAPCARSDRRNSGAVLARGGPRQAPPTAGGFRGADSPLRGVREAPHPTIRLRSLSVFIGHRQNEPGKRALRTIGGRRPARAWRCTIKTLMLRWRFPLPSGEGIKGEGVERRAGEPLGDSSRRASRRPSPRCRCSNSGPLRERPQARRRASGREAAEGVSDEARGGYDRRAERATTQEEPAERTAERERAAGVPKAATTIRTRGPTGRPDRGRAVLFQCTGGGVPTAADRSKKPDRRADRHGAGATPRNVISAWQIGKERDAGGEEGVDARTGARGRGGERAAAAVPSVRRGGTTPRRRGSLRRRAHSDRSAGRKRPAKCARLSGAILPGLPRGAVVDSGGTALFRAAVPWDRNRIRGSFRARWRFRPSPRAATGFTVPACR